MPKRRPFSSVQEITKDMTVEQRIERLEWHVNDIENYVKISSNAELVKMVAMLVFLALMSVAAVIFVVTVVAGMVA